MVSKAVGEGLSAIAVRESTRAVIDMTIRQVRVFCTDCFMALPPVLSSVADQPRERLLSSALISLSDARSNSRAFARVSSVTLICAWFCREASRQRAD